MRLVSLEEQARWTGSSDTVVNRHTANLTLAKGLQLSVTQISPASTLGVKLSGKGFLLGHDSPSLDTFASFQRPLLGGKLEVTQAVPGGRWFLVPTPTFKFSRSFSTPHALDRLSCKWDTLLRRGQLSQTMYCGRDCAYKASLQLDTWLGPAMSARAKLRRGVVQSVAASFSAAMGPVLCMKSRPMAGLKLRADTRLGPRVLAAQAKAIPYFLGSAPPMALTLDVTAPWGADAGGGKRRAAAVLGVKWRI
ncbi:hypothetical protein WJX81_002888 [Elliptochloris bilobata]|uniref:Uncharacterized protein n=1 Tax=Elliptochloris bilobata TaxID=381761 RepID=A0AAW1S8Q6_9CHLO